LWRVCKATKSPDAALGLISLITFRRSLFPLRVGAFRSIQTGKIAWEYPQIGSGGTWGGLLATAGGIVFFCDDGGAFAALDAASGNPLWQFNAGVSWHASPITYAVDGKQYVSIAAGSNILTFALP
jgi:alcohol dehydrogenase (cytochrome c)